MNTNTDFDKIDKKPERGNYKEMVEACFAHVGVLGKRIMTYGLKRTRC